MDNDIKSAVLLMTVYSIAILLCIIAENAVLAFGLLCSMMTILMVVVFQSGENQRLKRRLKKYKRAVEKLAAMESEDNRKQNGR